MELSEILKQAGIEEEIVESILNSMKENGVYTSAEENVDIRYGKLKDEHSSKLAELEAANKLIKELKKTNADNEDTTAKIGEYENQIKDLAKQLEDTKIESALKMALLNGEAVAEDIDYLTFKIKNDGEFKMELDENGNIKGIDDKVKGLKTQYPGHFKSQQQKKLLENPLPGGGNDNKISREEFSKMNYNDRAKLYRENPDAYHELSKTE